MQAEVRERDYFYSGAFYFFGIAIGVGVAALVDWFFGARPGERRSRIDAIGSVAAIAVLLAMTGLQYQRYHFEHDRTRERIPWGYGYNILAGLEPNSLIFTNGDNDTFPLWYQQEVEGFRKEDVRVINISLLNTGWYIEQLRENEPRVQIDLPEDYIRDPHGMYDRDGRVLQPRDIAMRQIIRDNFGKRPIYFAVTIPQENMADFEDYLILGYPCRPSRGASCQTVMSLRRGPRWCASMRRRGGTGHSWGTATERGKTKGDAVLGWH